MRRAALADLKAGDRIEVLILADEGTSQEDAIKEAAFNRLGLLGGQRVRLRCGRCARRLLDGRMSYSQVRKSAVAFGPTIPQPQPQGVGACRDLRLPAHHDGERPTSVPHDQPSASRDVVTGDELDLTASCRARVDALVEAEVSIGLVGRAIEAFPLRWEEKSELWLAAWSRRHPSVDDAGDEEMPAWGRGGLSRQPAVAATSSGLLAHD